MRKKLSRRIHFEDSVNWGKQYFDRAAIIGLNFGTKFPDCKPQLQMMYAGTYKTIIEECKLTKVFQIRDMDELDEEWIETHLGKQLYFQMTFFVVVVDDCSLISIEQL